MNESFGSLLHRLRLRAGLNVSELAQAVGASRASILDWEKGTRVPRDRARLEDLAQVLRLTPVEAEQLAGAARQHRREALKTASSIPSEPEAGSPAAVAAPASPRHQLRTPLPDFVGQHSAIMTLLRALLQGTQDGQVAAISGVRGMGGIGKTELAYLVANRLSATFPDGQIVVNLRGTSVEPLPPAQALGQVIHAFTPGARLPDDLEGLQRLYISALHGQRVLILADDASDAAQVRPLIPPASCVLLITSRVRFTLPGMIGIDLELLSEGEALRLLRTICPRLAIGEAKALAQACGYLPLALRISGSLLYNDPALSMTTYLARLMDERQRLAQLRDRGDTQLDVESVLALSYAQLNAVAQQVFRQLGVLIADFATELALSVVEAPQGEDVTTVLHLLLRRNLVMYDSAQERWRLHDLVRDVARQRLEAAGEADATRWRYARAAVQMAQVINGQYRAGGDGVLTALTRFDLERPHIDAARAWAIEQTEAPGGNQFLLDVAAATQNIGWLRFDRRGEIIPLAERALAAAQRLGDAQEARRVLSQLGIAYFELSDLQRALFYHEQALTIARTLKDRRGEGIALGNLGNIYGDLNTPRSSLLYYEQALAIYRELDDRRGEGITLINLGNVYTNLGDPGRAISYFEQAITILREVGNRRGEGQSLSNLGRAYTELGDARRAISYFEQAIAIYRALGDRRGESIVLTNLGGAYLHLGNEQRAIDACTAALAMTQEISERSSESYALSVLARAQMQQGNWAQARALFAQTLTLFCESDDRRGLAECQWLFGLSLVEQGEREEGLELLRAALSYEQEIGHVKAAEHAALVARLAAGEVLPHELAPSRNQRTVGGDT